MRHGRLYAAAAACVAAAIRIGAAEEVSELQILRQDVLREAQRRVVAQFGPASEEAFFVKLLQGPAAAEVRPHGQGAAPAAAGDGGGFAAGLSGEFAREEAGGAEGVDAATAFADNAERGRGNGAASLPAGAALAAAAAEAAAAEAAAAEATAEDATAAPPGAEAAPTPGAGAAPASNSAAVLRDSLASSLAAELRAHVAALSRPGGEAEVRRTLRFLQSGAGAGAAPDASLPCTSEASCARMEEFMNACAGARGLAGDIYGVYLGATNALNIVMSVLCACIFVGPARFCALRRFPYTCVFPYQVFSTFTTGASSVFEVVKTLSSLCRMYTSPSIAPLIE